MKILLLAGEESGLIYANALKARLAGHEVRGYADYGFETADLAVVGIWAVLSRLFYFLRVARTMKRAIDAWRPDVVLTIDYPGMNLKLAAYAKARGIRAVHVVCPQVWAWKQGRIPKIERALDALCCFFPFEPKLFRPGFATFVGHPLVGDFQRTVDAVSAPVDAVSTPVDAVSTPVDAVFAPVDAVSHRVIDGSNRPLSDAEGLRVYIALLPGSRRSEIAWNLPPLLDAARILAKTHPDLQFVIPAAHAAAEAQIRALVDAVSHRVRNESNRPLSDAERLRVHITRGHARETLLSARCAAVASGTATLEAALAKCPTVLVYRVSATLAWIARRVIKGTRFLGLANVLWDKCGGAGDEPPMPELLQEDFTPEAVAARLVHWLDDPSAREEAIRRMTASTDLLIAKDDPLSQILKVLHVSNERMKG